MNNHYQPPEDQSNPRPPEFQRDPSYAGGTSPQRVTVKMPASKPYVTYALIGFTIFIYLLQVGTQSLQGTDLPAAFGAKVNELIAAGQFWRLITPVFLHGSIMHIGFNMYALYLFGRPIERYFGRARFLLLYFISGFGGNVLSMMFTESPSLGASTAIFGLLAAQGIFIYQNRALFGGMTQQALRSIVIIAAINLMIGLSPGIDNWGHVGGLVAGLIFTWIGGPILAPDSGFPYARLVDQRETSDMILASVASGGFFVILAIGAIFLMGR